MPAYRDLDPDGGYFLSIFASSISHLHFQFINIFISPLKRSVVSGIGRNAPGMPQERAGARPRRLPMIMT